MAGRKKKRGLGSDKISARKKREIQSMGGKASHKRDNQDDDSEE
jgi:hypothetical protein